MHFSQKLSALMSALGVNNKTLADAIHLDPSLVSRWRSGKRLPGKNSDILLSLSDYFSQTAVLPYQKISLLSLMNLPLDAAHEQKTPLNHHLYHWLCEEEAGKRQSSTIAESFLLQAGDIGPKAAPGRQIHYEALPQGAVQSVEVFSGLPGMREACLKQLSLSLASGAPQMLSMFSDQSLDWLELDAGYDALWSNLILECLAKGDRIRVVHDVRRDSKELFNTIRRWLPFYMTGRVNSYYCPSHLHTIHSHTVNVAEGQSALSSFCYPGTEYEAEVRLHTNGKAVESMQRMLNHILQNSLPLISVYTAENYHELSKLHLRFSETGSDNISLMNMLTTFSSPPSLFFKIIDSLDLPVADKEDTRQQFRLKQANFHKGLQKNKYTEIISLPEPHRLRYDKLRFNLGVFLGHNDAYYQSPDEFKEHIANMIYLLKTYENYQCFLQRESPFKNVQIQARENVGVLFTKESETLFSFYLSQPSITQVFYNYLENLAAGLAKRRASRGETISRLEQYLHI